MTPPPIRLLHHFACTGGTLIAKSVASLANVTLLNEIDPLSRQHLHAPRQVFAPTDTIAALAYSRRDVGAGTLVDMFRAQLAVLKRELDATGRHLVLRDHPHSHFCMGSELPDRPTMQQIVSDIAPLRAVVTVRHPMASYVSLSLRNWVHFRPASIEEYARRYAAFLDTQGAASIRRYEDFVADPNAGLQQICNDLDLPFLPDFATTLGVFRLSGDSGRSDNRIALRPDRPVPSAVLRDAARSQAYQTLCARLGYDDHVG